MGKVWESGAVQVVQQAQSLSADVHPCNRLPGARWWRGRWVGPAGQGGKGRGRHPELPPCRRPCAFVGRRCLCGSHLACESRKFCPCRPRKWSGETPPDCCRVPAGALSRRIEECIYLPVYDRTGQGERQGLPKGILLRPRSSVVAGRARLVAAIAGQPPGSRHRLRPLAHGLRLVRPLRVLHPFQRIPPFGTATRFLRLSPAGCTRHTVGPAPAGRLPALCHPPTRTHAPPTPPPQ